MQTKGGLEVVGGELILHMSGDGVVRSVSASARGDEGLAAAPKVTAEAARLNATVYTPAIGATAETPRLVYVISSVDGTLHLAWESRVTAAGSDGVPVDDLVYVDALTGGLADRHPQIMTARSRTVYSANNGTSLPGSLKRSEGQAANSDTDVNAAYDNTGATRSSVGASFACAITRSATRSVRPRSPRTKYGMPPVPTSTDSILGSCSRAVPTSSGTW
jgi:vibriolysin